MDATFYGGCIESVVQLADQSYASSVSGQEKGDVESINNQEKSSSDVFTDAANDRWNAHSTARREKDSEGAKKLWQNMYYNDGDDWRGHNSVEADIGLPQNSMVDTRRSFPSLIQTENESERSRENGRILKSNRDGYKSNFDEVRQFWQDVYGGPTGAIEKESAEDSNSLAENKVESVPKNHQTGNTDWPRHIFGQYSRDLTSSAGAKRGLDLDSILGTHDLRQMHTPDESRNLHNYDRYGSSISDVTSNFWRNAYAET
ncbi:hypothetical protein GE061_008649 [Apolygus lucorum]|uniref:Uncharacterized protein n=1 Tax=Apolygus lucorum TaxID=248454 RepID=A0A8S9WLE3_APOLU|nr:hypothetical protein GE061_008649 [Apolygus lucorum]